MDTNIRILKEKDKKEISTFVKGLYETGYLSSLLQYHKKRPQRTIPFVYEDGNIIKAFCFFHFSNKESGWISGMRVKKQCQKSGIPTKFTRNIIEYATKKHLLWVGINTSLKNKSVQRICKKLKFTRYDAYSIYMFKPLSLKNLTQRKLFQLPQIKEKKSIDEYFSKRKFAKLLFIIDPVFCWIRLSSNLENSLITKGNCYRYNKKIIIMQRWGENAVFNIFGNYKASEYEDFLAQLYKEYRVKSKGNLLFCVSKRAERGMKRIYSKISNEVTPYSGEIQRSCWYVYGKFLR
jgi:hypothetical protein